MSNSSLKDRFSAELIRFGLSERESAVYIALLGRKECGASYLAKTTNIPRGSVYEILEKLEKLNFVSRLDISGKQKYEARSPTEIMDKIDEELDKLKSKAELVKEAVQELEMMQGQSTKRPKVHYSQGVVGARNVMEDTLSSKEKCMRAFIPVTELSEFIGSGYMVDYTNRRVQSGLQVKVFRTSQQNRLASPEAQGIDFPHDPGVGRYINYTDKVFSFPITFYIYDQKVAIISSKRESFSLTIEDDEFAKLQKSIFDFVWETWNENI